MKTVLLLSDKGTRAPGVSLVRSPQHIAGGAGVQVDFHTGEHTALERALDIALVHGGTVRHSVVDTGEGVRYITLAR